MKGIISWQTSV